MIECWRFYFLNRYASTQNQEGSGGSGPAEGVWWHPPSLWQGGLFLLFLISQINAVEDDFHLPCLTINWEHKLFKTETSLLLELKSVLFLVVSHLHLCSTEKAYGRPSCSQDCASEAHTQSESFCGIVFNICNCFLSVMFFHSKYEFNDHESTSCTTIWDKKHQIPFTLTVKSRMLKTKRFLHFNT